MNYKDSNFEDRHLGISEEQIQEMCDIIGVGSLEQLVNETVPDSIRLREELDLPEALSEAAYLEHVKTIGSENQIFKTYIGQGYNHTLVPYPILMEPF